MRSEEEIRERLGVMLTECARAEAKYAAHVALGFGSDPNWVAAFECFSSNLHYWTGQVALLEWVLGK